MIKTSIENLARPIGFDIGNSDNVVQAELLNGLCSGLTSGCGKSLDMQLSYITDKLDVTSCILLAQLGEFVKLRLDERAKNE